MRKFDLSLRSSRSSYFATFRHQLTILSKTDALDEEKWLNMLGTFVKDRKSGSAGMPRPISYAVFCLKKKKKLLSMPLEAMQKVTDVKTTDNEVAATLHQNP